MGCSGDAKRQAPIGHASRQLLLVLAVAMGHAPGAYANPLYRWTDSEGLQHYGDRPPPAEVEHAEQLSVPSYAAPGLAAEDDPYSILNQVKRLEASRENIQRQRREKERERREYYLRKRELEVRERAAEYPASTAPVYGYPRPVYPRPPIHRPPIHRPDRPGHHPPRRPGLWEPDHPAYRPYPHPPIAVPPPLGGGARIDLRR